MNPEIDISVDSEPSGGVRGRGANIKLRGSSFARRVVSLDEELFSTFSLFTYPGSGPFSKYLI